MENVESWSRTRRASAHSIGLSSRSQSVSSSTGPSSFTENLTFYMNDDKTPNVQIPSPPSNHRKHDFALPLSEKTSRGSSSFRSLEIDSTKLPQQLSGISREKYNEANDGPNSAETVTPNSKSNLVSTIDYEASGTDGIAAQDGPLDLELSFQGPYPLILPQRSEGLGMEERQHRLQESVGQNLTIPTLQANEPKIGLTEQARSPRLSQSQAPRDRQGLLKIGARVPAGEQDQIQEDELDDQSLIEELEDDLERTRHELARIIKDKKRVERQLEGTQADLKFERQRNQELEDLLTQARRSISLAGASCPQAVTIRDETIMSNRMMCDLKSVLDKAYAKMESLEEKLLERESNRSEEFKKFDIDTSPSRSPKLNTKDLETSNERVEAYIRKINTKNRLLKKELNEAQREGEALKKHVQEDETAIQRVTAEVDELKAKLLELEATRERMGRVLMYQWGKEEVGQIQRKGLDGKTELGMGFRYKYYRKDGTVK